MKRRATVVDAIRAHVSRLVTVMDTGQRQYRTDQCHAGMDTDHRHLPLTATDQSHAGTHTDRRQRPVTVHTDTDRRVTMNMGDRQRPRTVTEQSHAVVTARTGTRQSVTMDHPLVRGAPLGPHPVR
jgi:hypothetical protein